MAQFIPQGAINSSGVDVEFAMLSGQGCGRSALNRFAGGGDAGTFQAVAVAK